MNPTTGHLDTIVAPITALGGAVAIVRVSGPDAFDVARSVFGGWPLEPETRQALHGRFSTGDDGLCMPFEQGHGYTGEQAVEMSIHGSPAAVRLLIEACIRSGARPATPGEFSLRAFMNGRLDLSEAEAVRDTVAAQTDLQLRFANAQRAGAIRVRISALRDRAMKMLAAVEASVDFSEEIGDYDRLSGLEECRRLLSGLDDLIATERLGRIVRRGLRIAIIGEPNAGKSSLLNAILNAERSIVTPNPGTTRDTIEESVELAGVPCVLIDTAGLRSADDPAEQAGVARSLHAAETADVVWYVHDSTLLVPESLPKHDLIILNKADLLSPSPGEAGGGSVRLWTGEGVWLSALSGQGINLLADWVERYADTSTNDVAIDPRHSISLHEAQGAIEKVVEAMQNDLPDDLLSVGLRSAIHSLGEVTGETAGADMLERIFRDFCIGK